MIKKMKQDIKRNLVGKNSLAFLLSKQREFCARFMPVQEFRPEAKRLTKDPRKDPRVVWSLDAIVCFLQETAELRNIMPWKHWKDYSNWQPLISDIHEEIIDQLHFIINIAVTLGLGTEDIGEFDSYFGRQKEWLSKTGVDLTKLGSSDKVVGGNSCDDPRIKLTLSTITKLEIALNDFRNLFPWDVSREYSSWCPNYSQYGRDYRNIFGLFVRECVIWGLSEDLLMQRYLEKHDINIQRQEDGYSWNLGQKKL